jgi:integrase
MLDSRKTNLDAVNGCVQLTLPHIATDNKDAVRVRTNCIGSDSCADSTPSYLSPFKCGKPGRKPSKAKKRASNSKTRSAERQNAPFDKLHNKKYNTGNTVPILEEVTKVVNDALALCKIEDQPAQRTGEVRTADSALDIADASRSAMARLLLAGRSEATHRALAWRTARVHEWATARGRSLPFSRDDFMLFCTDLNEHKFKLSTIHAIVSAFRMLQRLAGGDDWSKDPYARQLLRGILRESDYTPRQMAPLQIESVRKICQWTQQNNSAIVAARDRGLFLVAYHGALRGQDVRCSRIENLNWSPDRSAVRLVLYKTKTDTHGQGQEVTIKADGTPECPIAALQAWLKILGCESGPLFTMVYRNGTLPRRPLSTDGISQLVKARVQAIGLDPDIHSAHSFRAGYVTDGITSGVHEIELMLQTRHKSIENFRKYYRRVVPPNVTRRLQW